MRPRHGEKLENHLGGLVRGPLFGMAPLFRRNPNQRNPMTHRLSPFAATLAALSSGLCAQGPVIDPARFTSYGATGCGVTLDGQDQILRGAHRITFDVSSAPANAPLALFLGAIKQSTPFPGLQCLLLTDMLVSVPATSSAAGTASLPVTAPSSMEGKVFAQVLTLDPRALSLDGSNGLEVLFPGTSPTVDPTTDKKHPCYYIENYTWDYPGDGIGAVVGQIRWPSDACSYADGPPPGRPIVIFMHGNGMTHTDHDYLMAHLAKNGFVACSIQNGGSNEDRARQAISYLNSMHRYWKFADRLSDDVAFMGHSRGGEAAVTAARLVYENPSWLYTPYDVDAVVSIAPTDGGGNNSDPRENLDGRMAGAFLGIYGSFDDDVTGKRLEDPLLAAENTVVAIYDRAGSEASSEGLLLPQHLRKALVWIDGATHRGFLDGCTPTVGSGGPIGCAAHKEIAQGFINAFLRWHIAGEAAYRAYFDGTSTPTSVRIRELTLWNQFSDVPRRTVDNFEQGGLGTSTISDTVTWSSGIAVIAEGELWQLDPSAPHDTRGARIKWGNGSSPWVRWGIPNVNVPNVGPARDVTRYDYLSFRAVQDYKDAWNPAGQDQDFYVRIFTGTGYSPFVRVSDFDRLSYPQAYIGAPPQSPYGDYTKSVLNTVRIPLSAFGGVDLTDVRSIYFWFTVAGHEAGSILVDSLEFLD
jgi:hypothetical protein